MFSQLEIRSSSPNHGPKDCTVDGIGTAEHYDNNTGSATKPLVRLELSSTSNPHPAMMRLITNFPPGRLQQTMTNFNVWDNAKIEIQYTNQIVKLVVSPFQGRLTFSYPHPPNSLTSNRRKTPAILSPHNLSCYPLSTQSTIENRNVFEVGQQSKAL